MAAAAYAYLAPKGEGLAPPSWSGHLQLDKVNTAVHSIALAYFKNAVVMVASMMVSMGAAIAISITTATANQGSALSAEETGKWLVAGLFVGAVCSPLVGVAVAMVAYPILVAYYAAGGSQTCIVPQDPAFDVEHAHDGHVPMSF